MCSVFRAVTVLALIAITAGVLAGVQPPPPKELRICADPNNLPFSNRREEGFENELAKMVAAELGRVVHYEWWPQRRGFVRNTLNAQRCDVVMGVPSNYELVRPTKPYYRSTYVFISRHDHALRISSLDDARLDKLRIGIHAVGDDYSSVPPAQVLGARGLASNIVGFSIYGDYSQENPPADLIQAVARADVDIGIAWGPLAGYFAKHSSVPLDVVSIRPEKRTNAPPMTFAISMGVRKQDQALLTALNQFIEHRRDDINRVLARYNVPTVRN